MNATSIEKEKRKRKHQLIADEEVQIVGELSPCGNHSTTQSPADDYSESSKKTSKDSHQNRLYIALLSVFIVSAFYCISKLLVANSYEDSTLPAYSNDPKALRVVLYGDSLIKRPFMNFNLGGQLFDALSTRHQPINFHHVSWNGDTIGRMRKRLDQVLEYKPHAVIMQFDSDVSDIHYELLTTPQIEELRTNYVNAVKEVIINLQTNHVEFIALSGPILLGECNWWLPSKFYFKYEKLEEYRALNRKIAQELKIPYLDMRSHFQNNLPFYWILPHFFLTTDGEHPNRKGTKLIANGFVDLLGEWLQTRDDSKS